MLVVSRVLSILPRAPWASGLAVALGAFALALCLGSSPAKAESEEAAEGEGEVVSNDYAEGVISLGGIDYRVAFHLSGAEPTVVNGQQMVTPADLPVSVDVARADGATMADQGYVARDVLDAACKMRGFAADPSVVPTLSPAGQWIFPAGCLF